VPLVDGSHREGLNALSRTLFLARDPCDRAIEDIRLLAPPAPRSEDIARVRPRKSQEEEEVVTFDTVTPTRSPSSTTSSRPSPARSPTRRT
jgi:hypothetical protein